MTLPVADFSEHAALLLADAAAALIRKLAADVRIDRRAEKRVRKAEQIFGYDHESALHDRQRALAELRRAEALLRQHVWTIRAAKAAAPHADPIIGKRITRRGH